VAFAIINMIYIDPPAIWMVYGYVFIDSLSEGTVYKEKMA
jgi:hypothetical protein